MKTILYIHGFNGNPKGGTFSGLQEFARLSQLASPVSSATNNSETGNSAADESTPEEYEVISFHFPELHLDVAKTQALIDSYIEENNVSVVVGASLGGFYALSCQKPVQKIAINPCMVPSVEIPLLRNKISGEPITVDPAVLEQWKILEQYKIPENCRNAFGIFGKDDQTFHFDENHNFMPLFQRMFPSNRYNTVLVEGQHSLETDQIVLGMNEAVAFFNFLR